MRNRVAHRRWFPEQQQGPTIMVLLLRRLYITYRKVAVRARIAADDAVLLLPCICPRPANRPNKASMCIYITYIYCRLAHTITNLCANNALLQRTTTMLAVARFKTKALSSFGAWLALRASAFAGFAYVMCMHVVHELILFMLLLSFMLLHSGAIMLPGKPVEHRAYDASQHTYSIYYKQQVGPTTWSYVLIRVAITSTLWAA